MLRSALVGVVLVGLLVPGGSFVDDDSSIHEGAIEAIARIGVTRGCNPPTNDRYCPDERVSRGEMAAFLRRALELPAAASPFADTTGSVFGGDIGGIAAEGIARGCDPPDNSRFCPDDPVTRGQMAAFLARAFGLPDGPDPGFADTSGSVFVKDIAALAGAGITRGCNPPDNSRFCPNRNVTRAEMATFLARALSLDISEPPPRCPVLPPDDIWNTRVDTLAVDPRSADYVNTIGPAAVVHPDFGSGEWPLGSGSPIGIPFVEIESGTPKVEIEFTAYGAESDPGPYPIPPDAPVEGGPNGTGDRHVIVVDRFDCRLYELFDAHPRPDGTWEAASGAVFDLDSSDLRPDGWTSADAAGLPIFPGLVRYDEVVAGEIAHAIRFTAPVTRRTHVWPARHDAGSTDDLTAPPMGQRFRLKASFDASGFHPDVQVILTAMKRYGLVLADNGSPWFLSGAPDPRWDNDVLRQLRSLRGDDFEAVDVSGLMVDPDTGTAG